jgi:hypothetical protein
MKPIVYVRPRVRVFAICTGKFGSDFLKFETFDGQEVDDMMLL